ncbi:MAG: hypothetical protein CMF42_00320 [Legionellales bacterium]|nr:hypothetical protein [Legionellales bacterium]
MPEKKYILVGEEEEKFTYFAGGTFNEVYINEDNKFVIKVPKGPLLPEEKGSIAERNAAVWNACKRPEIGNAEVVFHQTELGKQHGFIPDTSIKMPYLPFPTAKEASSDKQKTVINAVRKESIRIFLKTGRVIGDGHLDNFLYDANTNTAHCIDHDLAHDVTLTGAKEPLEQKFLINLKNCDDTGIGRVLNEVFRNDEIFICSEPDDKFLDLISNEMNTVMGVQQSKDTQIKSFATALRRVLVKNDVNPLFFFQNDLRAYINLRLGSETALQGVQDKDKGDWKGWSGDKGKLNLLKDLLTSIQQCDPKDTGNLELLLENIQNAKNNNLQSEKGGPIGGLVKQARNMLGRHPGGELGKLLDNCEKHVNDIKANLDKTPTLRH